MLFTVYMAVFSLTVTDTLFSSFSFSTVQDPKHSQLTADQAICEHTPCLLLMALPPSLPTSLPPSFPPPLPPSLLTHSLTHSLTTHSLTPSFPPSLPPSLPSSLPPAYYYHNCHFRYSVRPPTFKSVRHSYYKLQALLENSV